MFGGESRKRYYARTWYLFAEGYSIFTGAASTLPCRRVKVIIVIPLEVERGNV